MVALPNESESERVSPRKLVFIHFFIHLMFVSKYVAATRPSQGGTDPFTFMKTPSRLSVIAAATADAFPISALLSILRLAVFASALLTTGCDFAKCRNFHCFFRAIWFNASCLEKFKALQFE